MKKFELFVSSNSEERPCISLYLYDEELAEEIAHGLRESASEAIGSEMWDDAENMLTLANALYRASIKLNNGSVPSFEDLLNG